LTLPEKLKSGTQTEHAQLEKQLVGKMKAIRGTVDYISLLKLFYGFFHPLEKEMLNWLHKGNMPDVEERRKSTEILNDIRALGGQTESMQESDSLPPITSYLQALGAAYVLEGSTLGGTVIAGMMRKQLAKEDDGGLSFFQGYGENTREMWRKFNEYLLAVQSPEDQEIVLTAARDSFLSFKKWADQYA